MQHEIIALSVCAAVCLGSPRTVADPAAGYLQDFLDEIAGTPSRTGVTTARVLAATRRALEVRVAIRPLDS
jgi:hypothetical protein